MAAGPEVARPIAVIGAAGVSGLELLRALRAAALPVRAVVHSSAGAERVASAGATQIVQAELADADSVMQAVTGAASVYMIPPSLHPDEHSFAIGAMRAAEQVGVSRFVYVSVLHPHTPAMAHHMRKAAVETQLQESSLTWTILQPAMYAQVVCRMFGSGPSGKARIPFNVDQLFSVIDLRELAEVAVKTLTESGHEYASYELCSTTLTMAEMVRVAGSVRGVRLQAESVPPESAPVSPRLPASSAADLRAMFAEYDRNGLRGNNTVLRALLGRNPASFAQIAKDTFG
jgi:NAD(P)H dehydrogenase (quinone)